MAQWKYDQLLLILSRLQFPLHLAFALSINKAQRQSVKYVGIDLQTPVFSQLYSSRGYIFTQVFMLSLTKCYILECVKQKYVEWLSSIYGHLSLTYIFE